MVDWKFYIDSPLTKSLKMCRGSVNIKIDDDDYEVYLYGDEGNGTGHGVKAGYGFFGDGESSNEW